MRFILTNMMNILVLILVFLTAVLSNNQTDNFPDCKSGPLATFPICEQSLPARQRAADLISRMMIHEKAGRLVNMFQPLLRLGLPQFQ